MTLPRDVQENVGWLDKHGRDDAWSSVRAHLVSQEESITNLRSAAQKAVLANADLRVRANLAESRLAAANALLRTIAAYTPPAHECARGCPKETCEACKLAKYLQGAGDEA